MSESSSQSTNQSSSKETKSEVSSSDAKPATGPVTDDQAKPVEKPQVQSKQVQDKVKSKPVDDKKPAGKRTRIKPDANDLPHDAVHDDKLLTISAELEQCIRDGQRLLTYISRNGSAELDPKLTENIIDAKRHLALGEWTVAQEQQYLVNYDKLAKSVFPVTVESINAIIPDKISKKPASTKAQKAVAWYRRYTLVALVLMLLVQLYWLLGNELRTNLDKTFEVREQTREQMIKLAKDQAQQEELRKTLTLQDQEFDANYNLLKAWNQVWMMGRGFNAELPPYFAAQYEHQKAKITETPGDPLGLGELDLQRKLHEVRIVYFEHLLTADFVLNSLQGYILPLLYGLLGAFIYVLRSLMGEIKALTYSYDSEIRYRLRLTLGALGGMIIGWFLKPEEAGAVASLSPMALAFLMGYNVDLLFTLMDKIIDNIKQSIEKPQHKKPPTAHVAPEPVANKTPAA